MLPTQWHRLIFWQCISKSLKRLISALTRLLVATLRNKPIYNLLVLYKVILSLTLKFEALLRCRVKYWSHFGLFF